MAVIVQLLVRDLQRSCMAIGVQLDDIYRGDPIADAGVGFEAVKTCLQRAELLGTRRTAGGRR